MSNSRESAPKPSLLAKFLLLAGALLVAIVLGEVGLRVIWHNPYTAEKPDRLLKLSLQHPNTDHFIDRSVFDPAAPRARFRSDERAYLLPSRVHDDPDVRTRGIQSVRLDATGLATRIALRRAVRRPSRRAPAETRRSLR